ncbi:MAG: hypothetical protein IJ880_11600 [Bacilli bacterium]|nr:hypothetical protein [Bacilli bacterium]
MSKEITITNANNFHSFISFQINGLEDGITVGIVPDPNSHGQALSVAYKGDIKIVPLSANTTEIKKINEDDKITVPLNMSKETYEWLISPADDDGYIPFDVIPTDEPWQPNQVTELDDEAYDKFEKEVMNPEPDMKKVEAAKKIFEGVEEIPVDASDLWKHERTHYGEPHLLELMDEWGVNGSNYADFRSVIQEHCFDKGLYAFDDIEKTWKEHQESIKNAVKGFDINDLNKGCTLYWGELKEEDKDKEC